jgi:hypothetical protein
MPSHADVARAKTNPICIAARSRADRPHAAGKAVLRDAPDPASADLLTENPGRREYALPRRVGHRATLYVRMLVVWALAASRVRTHEATNAPEGLSRVPGYFGWTPPEPWTWPPVSLGL